MRSRLLLVFFLSLHMCTYSQTVTGSWYGNADVMLSGRHNNYLAELIIKQKGDEVVGILGYYFKNGYQSVYIHGEYDKASHTIAIDDIPMTYFRAKDIDGVNCYMDFTGVLVVSRVKSNINGYFTSADRYKYTCPELRIMFDLDNSEYNKQDSLIKNTVARKFWSPLPQDVIVSNGEPVKAAEIIYEDSIREFNNATVKATPSLAMVAPTIPVVALQQLQVNSVLQQAFEARKNIYSDDVIVESDSVRVSFYDNGEIDGDSISVFLNNQPILVKQGLAATAINLYIHLDKSKEVNELSMFAENLGKYPPNTALMVVSDGVNRQEIYLSSSLTQNATVRLRRRK